MKSPVEEGLRLVIGRRASREDFHLRRASFKSKGLQPGISANSWNAIREMSYLKTS